MRLLITLSYLGTNYHGWQVQANALTVQQAVQDALQSVFGSRLPLTGCSRTDSGVHAHTYCCHADCPDNSSVSPERVPDALNAHLPRDISVRGCRVVPPDFHARYSVKSKTYEYTILNSPFRDPFLAPFACHVRPELDFAAMKRAAKHFLGRHDFKSFQSAGSSVEDTVRDIMALDVRKAGDVITLSVTADGFLYNMVRIIAGTLIDVGREAIKPADIPRIIEGCDRAAAGKTAPAHGLTLVDVNY